VAGERKLLGLIAGNGRFPFLILDAARAEGTRVVVAAIREETEPEIDERAAADAGIELHWLSLGELSKLIETFQRAGVKQAVMAGQVKHKQIFSAIRPDWRLAKLLLNLRSRSTDALLGAVAKVLSDEGIELISSTALLEPMLAQAGVMTRRTPSEDERRDIEYGKTLARALAGYDVGQTVVVAGQACVAVEAMEGTDATIARAGELVRGAGELVGDEIKSQGKGEDKSEGEGLVSRALTVVKVAKPEQDFRFDVPVIGAATIAAMRGAGAMCLALEAGRTLVFDREGVVRAADAAGIAIVAE
jgi:UDP-2,3-diacylglucosamine hydrolase